jgi:hypothetical protein
MTVVNLGVLVGRGAAEAHLAEETCILIMIIVASTLINKEQVNLAEFADLLEVSPVVAVPQDGQVAVAEYVPAVATVLQV